MHTSKQHYFRHYQLRLSNSANNAAAAILKEDDGMNGHHHGVRCRKHTAGAS